MLLLFQDAIKLPNGVVVFQEGQAKRDRREKMFHQAVFVIGRRAREKTASPKN